MHTDAPQATQLTATPSHWPALMDITTLAAYTSMSKTKLRQLADDGRLPRPARLGKRCPRWPRAEIDTWIAGGCRRPGATE